MCILDRALQASVSLMKLLLFRICSLRGSVAAAVCALIIRDGKLFRLVITEMVSKASCMSGLWNKGSKLGSVRGALVAICRLQESCGHAFLRKVWSVQGSSSRLLWNTILTIRFRNTDQEGQLLDFSQHIVDP